MGQPDIIHYFSDSLAYSQEQSHAGFWEQVYVRAFPDMIGMMSCDGKNQSQYLGIDRVIQLSSGKTLYIDEKKRGREWDDILLEYISNDKSKTKGWMEKDLLIDYLAYAFMPSRRCYLFDWNMLRRVWLHKKEEWLGDDSYKKIQAKNDGYTTWSVAIPKKELFDYMNRSWVIDLNKRDQ